MRAQNSKLIILGHKNIGEADKLIFALSQEFGKIKFIARGARRIKSKFHGHLETLNIVDAMIYFSPRNTLLLEIKNSINLKELRENLEKLYAVLQIAEVTEKCLEENQQFPKIFKLLEQSIKYLKTSDKNFEIKTYFIINLLNELGLFPNLKELGSKKVEEKYIKFFTFTVTNPIHKAIQIRTTETEKNYAESFIHKLLEYQIQRSINSFNLKNQLQ